MDSYRMLAELFGKSEKLRVVMREGVPQTDGQTIYLPEYVPEEMTHVLLGVLIHEAYHIRHTDFRQGDPQRQRQDVLNCLEDMRIDNRAMSDWPNAANLYAHEMEYIRKTHADKFAQCPWQVKTLQNLITRSWGRPLKFAPFMWTDAEVVLWETANATFIDDLTKRVLAAKNTGELKPMMEELLARLFPGTPQQEQRRQEGIGKLSKGGQGSMDGRSRQKEAQNKAKADTQKVKESDGKARESEKDSIREKSEAALAKEKADKADKKAQDKRDEAAQARKDGDKQKAKDLDAEADELEKEAQEAKAEAKAHEQKAKDKLDEAKASRAEADEAYKNMDSLKAEYEQAAKDAEAAERELTEAQNTLDEISRERSADEQKGLNGLSLIGTGFDKIRKEDLKMTKLIPENIEDEVVEFLRQREERMVQAFEGRINPKRLPTFFNPETLLQQEVHDATYKTRVHFLVDRSGSMGSHLPGADGETEDYTNTKAKLATQAVLNLAKAIEKAKTIGIDVEYGIFSFDDSVQTLKDFEEELDNNRVTSGLHPRGGTNPCEIIRDVEDKYRPDNPRTKEVVFFITDGEFDSSAYELLEQQTSGHIKWVCIGLNANTSGKARALFGENNVQRSVDFGKILGHAIMANID